MNLFPNATGAGEDWRQKQAIKIMAKKLGSWVVGCVVVGASWSAQATPVTLDFSSLVLSTTSAPVPASYQGFSFTSVTAYKSDGSSTTLTTLSGAAIRSLAGFTIGVGTQLFDTISFYAGSLTGTITATAFDAANSTLNFSSPAGGANYWNTAPTILGSFSPKLIDHVSFASSSAQLFSIDNIIFSLSTDTGGSGGTVPEPASFGLVALALLGAGAVSRRRKSA